MPKLTLGLKTMENEWKKLVCCFLPSLGSKVISAEQTAKQIMLSWNGATRILLKIGQQWIWKSQISLKALTRENWPNSHFSGCCQLQNPCECPMSPLSPSGLYEEALLFTPLDCTSFRSWLCKIGRKGSVIFQIDWEVMFFSSQEELIATVFMPVEERERKSQRKHRYWDYILMYHFGNMKAKVLK